MQTKNFHSIRSSRKATPNEAFFIVGQTGSIPFADGGPGTGKTSVIECFGRSADRWCAILPLSGQAIEDICGSWSPDKNAGFMRKLLPEWFHRATTEPCVVFFDELTNVDPTRQAAALNMMANMGGKSWWFAAGNGSESAADYYEFTPPMANRLCHLKWDHDERGYIEALLNGGEFSSPTAPILPADWRDGLPQWAPLFGEFFKSNPGLIQVFPAAESDQGKAWPSKRSWFNAVQAFAGASSVDAPMSVFADILEGFVGLTAATSFWSFAETLELPDPETVLANPGGYKVPKFAHLGVVTMAAVVAAVKRNLTNERWESLMEVCDAIEPQKPELHAAFYGACWGIKPPGYATKRLTSPLLAMAK